MSQESQSEWPSNLMKNCGSCEHWMPNNLVPVTAGNHIVKGVCRRYAPSHPSKCGRVNFPTTFYLMSCGEWKHSKPPQRRYAPDWNPNNHIHFCLDCRYWEISEAAPFSDEIYVGGCTRYPPTEPEDKDLGESEYSTCGFIPTTADYWCGEWDLDDRKLK